MSSTPDTKAASAMPAMAPMPSVPTAPAATPAPGHSAFVPVLISLLALSAWAGAQLIELSSQRTNLQTAHASQQQTVDNAAKLRASLDALASDTQRLANAGNASAALLVDELRKRGVTINLTPPPAAAPAGSAPR